MHVADRWHVTRDGKKVRSDRYGKGKGWVATWKDDRGFERSKAFELRVDAEDHLATTGAELLSGRYIDPARGKSPSRSTPSSGARTPRTGRRPASAA